ncbi:copper amine oxidase N-terminal domain-containing protein [Tumebacillus flagellatus]|uniref:Copper amine oxidase-like N-terminal domain-containing protein n=1 Tax=Tumebacillus flagellatus TaxID=1157490 RepID=A0A074LRL7_9BACL|nr:copper amine oxidase N-terminal domain-containing protein [Tumebacillus flagellatus]KEO82483.1 hypothetical protein EL26_15510 [Tumebacillus flagellatus]
MKKSIRPVLGAFLTGAMLLTLWSGGTATAASNIRVLVDNKPVQLSYPAVLDRDRVLVPLRGVVEAMHGAVQWLEADQTAQASLGGRKVWFPIDSTTMGLNLGEGTQWKTIDVPAQIRDGHTMVPLRALSEGLGCNVGWDGATNTVRVTAPSKSDDPTIPGTSGGNDNPDANGNPGTTPSTPTPVDPNTGSVISQSLPVTQTLGNVDVTVVSMEVLATETMFRIRIDNNSTMSTSLLAGMSTMKLSNGKTIKHLGAHMDPNLFGSVEPNNSLEGYIALPGIPTGNSLLLTTQLYGNRQPLVFPIAF